MGYLSLLIIGLLASYANSFAPSIGRFFKSNVLNMVVSRNVDMPALSSTMTEGKIVSWNKKVGDKVSAGDVLLIVESDKADMDVEAFEDGYLAAIYTPEGESAAVGAAVAILVDSFADIANIGSAKAPVSPAVVAAAAAPAAAETVAIPAPVAASAPQFEQVTMPALSSTMTEGKVVSWSKKIGDKITSGDMVLIVESDKADMDVESYEEGFLAAILVGEGESAPVGSPVGLMAKTLAEIPAVQKYAEAMKSGSPIAALTVAVVMEAVVSPKEAIIPVAAPVIVNDGRVASSGYAKTVAKDQNIDLRTVTPSRADGLITAKDLATGSIANIAAIAASNGKYLFLLDILSYT
jgi:pyruvate dehydrogenase E2 component (dihydrolipoamide acetyltransferase)